MPSQNSINNTVSDNAFSQIEVSAGVSAVNISSHTDNTNAASHSVQRSKVGGASGGDPFLHLQIGDVVFQRSFGMDNSAGDLLKITDGADPSNGTIHWQMTTVGERTMPAQPAFLATQTTAQDNMAINTTHTLTVNNEIFDQNSDYNAGTFTFTAPITGRYQFTLVMRFTGIDVDTGFYNLQITTSNRTYLNTYPVLFSGDPNFDSIVLTTFADMDASDTAIPQLFIPNAGANQTDVDTTDGVSYFSGVLIV